MKKFIPLTVLLLCAAWLISTLFPPKSATEFNIAGFGKLPILVNGRLKPMDTVARSSLLHFQNRQRVSDPASDLNFPESPTAWLLDAFFNAEKADQYPTFRIDSPELLNLMGIGEEETKVKYDSTVKQAFAILGFLPSNRSRFSFNQLKPNLGKLLTQSELAQQIDTQKRTPFQSAVVQLHRRIAEYQELKHSLILPDSPDFLGELLRFQDAIPVGIAAVRAKQQGQDYNEDAFKTMITLGKRYDGMAEGSRLHPVPPPETAQAQLAWLTTGLALLDTFQTGSVNPTVLTYAGLAHAWRAHQPEQFNKILELYQPEVEKRFGPELTKTNAEVRFNAAEPFYNSMIIYVLAFFIAIFSWLKWPEALGRSAFWLIVLAWIATTAGIATRMWLEGRPPVTNLYSSALFVGWGAAFLCIILEKIYKNGIGSVAAGMVGFSTLLIAHHLSLSGDTLEMMRAVLDSNFWLATHVVVVTTGYSATFLAGFLAVIYIVRGLFTRSLDKKTADSLARMVYGIVCFATLFSLIGTVLGGIWADQSWGRFWGWDPKENGALIIVLWNAIILHARWGGLVKQRGLMCLAIFGNIVTSWSWFGTNMLGIGLHSYGFMDQAFWWLAAFIVSQLALIALANLPLEKWRSFQPRRG